jgi:hypothetical protein
MAKKMNAFPPTPRYFMLSSPSIRACFAGEFQSFLPFLQNYPAKTTKSSFVSAAGAKRAEHENNPALIMDAAF